MARVTPRVRNNYLRYRTEAGEITIRVGSQEWWLWLQAETTMTFRFETPQGSFTARRERKSGGLYWYAYRKRDGKLRKAYLGKAEELHMARLKTIEAILAGEPVPGVEATGELVEDGKEADGYEHGLGNGDVASYATGMVDARRNGSLDVVLVTKLSLPPARADLVPRTRLSERMSRGIRRSRLVLMAAPAGFGKTTVLSAWQRQANSDGLPLAWVGLDENDNDLLRFWTYVVAALQVHYSGIGEAVLRRLHASQPPPIETLLTMLINEISAITEEFALAFDDYHVITSQPIHHAVAFLLEHLPEHMHLIIVSRNDPPLPLARLRARGMLTELRASELRFTLPEVSVFLNQVMGLNLSGQEIEALDQHTEGWAVGLQLAALSMQGREDRQDFIATFTGCHRYILDYLAVEVFQRQPPHIQEFLLSTAILDRLSESLCNAVTQGDDARPILESVEESNLFLIPLDEQRRWYRYHHLFAEFLRARLQREQPERVMALHHRAADWYERNGLLNEAVGHARATGDYKSIAGVIDRYADELVKRGELRFLSRWFRLLPDALVRNNLRLSAIYAGTLGSIGELDEGEARLRDAERVLTERLERGEAVSLTDQGGVAAARIFLTSARGDVQQTRELVRQAFELLPPELVYERSLIMASLGQAYVLRGELVEAGKVFMQTRAISEAAGNKHALLMSVCIEGYMCWLQGRLTRAIEAYENGLRLGTEGRGQFLPGVIIAYVGIAAILYERNDLEGAVERLRVGIEIGQLWGSVTFLTNGYTCLALTQFARGHREEADEAWRQAEKLTRRHTVTTATRELQAGLVRFALSRGDEEMAAGWMQDAHLRSDDVPDYLREYEDLTLARILIHRGMLPEVEALLKHVQEVAETEGRMRSVIEALALRALTRQAAGEVAAALGMLKRALTLAEAEGYIRSFVDLGGAMEILLREALAHEIRPVYVRKLLVTCVAGQGGSVVKGNSHEGQEMILEGMHLSDRELKVLQGIAAGKSNQQLARDFVVALSTIKTHINNIYTKLGVHSRTQALVRAKELGLRL